MKERVKLENYVNNLLELSNLSRNDLSQNDDDDVSNYMPDCIKLSVIILGNHFDEILSTKIREVKRMVNGLYNQNIKNRTLTDAIKPEIFHTIFKDNMKDILNKDVYGFIQIDKNVNELLDAYLIDYCNVYEIDYSKKGIKLSLDSKKRTMYNTLDIIEHVINPIEKSIDETYVASKRFSEWCVEKIKYNYAYNNGVTLKELSYFAIDSIIYLYRYYRTLLGIHTFLIDLLIQDLGIERKDIDDHR